MLLRDHSYNYENISRWHIAWNRTGDSSSSSSTSKDTLTSSSCRTASPRIVPKLDCGSTLPSSGRIPSPAAGTNTCSGYKGIWSSWRGGTEGSKRSSQRRNDVIISHRIVFHMLALLSGNEKSANISCFITKNQLIFRVL